jgi:hypothetical protein
MKVHVRDSLFNDLLVLFTEDRLARILDILLAGDGEKPLLTVNGANPAITAGRDCLPVHTLSRSFPL